MPSSYQFLCLFPLKSHTGFTIPICQFLKCASPRKKKDLVKANKSKHVKLPSFFIFSKKTKVHCVCVLNFESPLYNYPKTVKSFFLCFRNLNLQTSFIYFSLYYHHFFYNKVIFFSTSPFSPQSYVFFYTLSQLFIYFLEENLICFKEERLGCNGFMVHFSSKI